MKLINKLKERTSDSFFSAILIGFLSGVIFGFILSPIKKGISIGSNNNITQIEGSEDDDEILG